ncbi:carbohydrate ABC transporter permease [Terrarubrum flagellatum]|uniref:carbohydrate ABC transporter permease n=1 Tax=Terrirubrum flagellatum TaxID=2895980 RepID=UPI003144EEEC
MAIADEAFAPQRRSKAQRDLLAALAIHSVLIAGALLMIYPLVWLFVSSLKTDTEIFSNASFWPSQIQFQNYIRGWQGAAVSFGTFFRNSLVVSTAAVIGNVFACSLVAFAFARIDFRFKPFWFALMMGTIMLPHHATLIPQYILFHKLGWVNTFMPLIAPKLLAVDAFFVFLMIQFIRGIPREIDEAALIDGASTFMIYRMIIFPLMRPALIATAIFTFVWTYEDFLTPLVYLSDIGLYTVPQGLRLMMSTTGQSSWGPLLAMSLLSLVPLLIVFLFFQKRLIDGIATTGLKG